MSQIMQHDFGSGPVAGHYYAKSLGAPFKVFLANGAEEKRNLITGKTETRITDLPGLIAAVVRARVLHPRKLSPADLKFIRSALRLKSNALAASIDLTKEHYCRCESGQKTMSVTTEKVYRANAYLTSICRDKNVLNAVQQEREKEPEKKISPEKATKAIEEFRKLFLEMKIHPVADAEHQLEFFFYRGCSDLPCGDDDAEWTSEVVQAAA
jgi:hypothetical protein